MMSDSEYHDLFDGEPGRPFISLGSIPCDEEEACAQVSLHDEYRPQMMAECVAYRDQLLRLCGPPPDSARMAVKWFAHEFGTGAQVVCYYDESTSKFDRYAIRLDRIIPSRWDERARRDLEDMGVADSHTRLRPQPRDGLLREIGGRLHRIDCLTRTSREYALIYARTKLSDEALEDYCWERLPFLRRVIASVDVAEFLALSTAVASASEEEMVLSHLGLEPSDATTWLQRAHTIQQDASACLCALAQHFAIPIILPQELEAVSLMLLSFCLQRLEREIDAAYVLESFLELSFEDYAASDFPRVLGRRLTRIRSEQRHRFVVTLARALQSLDRDEDASLLMDGFAHSA